MHRSLFLWENLIVLKDGEIIVYKRNKAVLRGTAKI